MTGPRGKLTWFVSALGRWPIALATVTVIALLLVLPNLGGPGMWEPQERQLVDRVAPPRELDVTKAKPVAPPRVDGTCSKVAPPDPSARSLGSRALAYGRDLDDSDGGRRLPFAAMALLTLLATCGVAMRLAGGRAAVLTAIALLAMPLFALQARMVTSDIGTSCGGALIIYGLVAVATSRRGRGPGWVWWWILDLVVAAAAIGVGSCIGFHGGGALFGLLVPIGAFAAASNLGVRELGDPSSHGRRVDALLGLLAVALAVGITLSILGDRVPLAIVLGCVGVGFLRHRPGLLATAGSIVLVALLAEQMYALRDPASGVGPSARQVLGAAVVPDGCWSTLLGGLWRPDDDLRAPFDSMFEQIAYGTLPWGVLAPIAILSLLHGGDRGRRFAGALSLAWGAAAWIASETFARKVGFNVYAGFPSLALAVGVWLDDVIDQRSRGERPHLGLLLLALFLVLAVVDLGKDLHSFPDHMTSLLVGSDQVPYPKQARLLALPLKTWILALAAITTIGFALFVAARGTLSRIGLGVALAMSLAIAVFWSYVWLPRLSVHLSSKEMFETYQEVAKPGERLLVMGDLGSAPTAYLPRSPDVSIKRFETAAGREPIVRALGEPQRVFAIAPQSELCTLHRELAGKPYYVLEDRNVRSLLLSNKLEGAVDRNPLATTILHTLPANIPSRPKGPIVWDKKIELLGWSVPARVGRGDKFAVTLYYKILAPVGGSWKSLMHFDGPLRFNGDHDPIAGRCPTSTWQPGDFVVDTHVVTAGGSGFSAGRYDMWIGFFTGQAPNWKNMTVSEAPPDQRDTADRVKILSIQLH